MSRVSAVNGTISFRQPQLHPVLGDQRQQFGELVAEERTLILADHYRINPAIRVPGDAALLHR